MNFGKKGNPERVAYLIAGFIRETLTEKEHAELDEWVVQSDENLDLFSELTDLENVAGWLIEKEEYNMEEALARIKEMTPSSKSLSSKSLSIKSIYAIAASIFLLAAIYLIYQFVKVSGKESALINNGMPGKNTAILTLGTGEKISVDDRNNMLLKDGFTTITNFNGQLSYKGQQPGMISHSLATAKGGQYRVTLQDGTTVWLNAESSLQYPAAFDGRERVVSLRGEGYFEIAPDTERIFRVLLEEGAVVEALGTHFNINAYGDEDAVKIYLKDGSVKLTGSPLENAILLHPGQQAIIHKKNFEINLAVMEEVLAWKNGWFEFKDASIEHIMRQVSRWYNTRVVYEAKVPHHFTATVSRKEPVSRLLELLELTGRVQFRISDSTIIVSP
ncbi:MAG TPA: FecR domain-containing protein [Chitinophagaceae bacterium]|nr:FecR domain-containing protein [Chitinophagaceae bacterium]